MDFDDKQVKDKIKEWYSKAAEYEWERLQQDPYHQIEFIITIHFLEKYLPKKGLILDAGGGPGRYAIELAKRGYDIILVDLIPEMLEIAKKKLKEAGLTERIKQIYQWSIEDLSEFSDEKFDAVLCLGGSLGHLLNINQRETSVKELIRVTKEGAPIFVSVISRIGLLRTILVEFTDEIEYATQLWNTGDYIPNGTSGSGFAPTHFFLPEELVKLFEKQGVVILNIAGLEGLSSHHKKETNLLYENKEKWNTWLELVIETSTHPSVIGSSEHFLLICRKNQ
ncbi:MAG: class I SAM-dependent methyltransferase [Candidatus Hodarchaeota archaeon]